jgi:hypothetical protein
MLKCEEMIDMVRTVSMEVSHVIYFSGVVTIPSRRSILAVVSDYLIHRPLLKPVFQEGFFALRFLQIVI